ncbi:hypothetical protein [Gordonia sp. ABSL49_1]|uniref:hypothetical protein n=1 Tax=Gordonia sp. ABSL49_1 TaxID=2920941 RepID=UPI001F0DFEC9|nr:hypothetical protein [Gordonia sp. ABSL49_1]MCH5644369.1 hypothetical protein [Gordonia sp. ABSL49_1]
MTDNQITNRRRAALILRAQLDDDTSGARAVLDEAWADGCEAALCGIIASLTTALTEQLAYATGGNLEAAKKTVDLTLLDLSVDPGGQR